MKRRMPMGRGKSRSDFRRKSGVHPKNIQTAAIPRGGYRL